MKKVLFVVMATGMFLGLVGCNKDYTCECKYTDGAGAATSFSATYEGVKKSKAEEACEAADATYKIIDANASCSLK